MNIARIKWLFVVFEHLEASFLVDGEDAEC